ncbi:condensation domain-containing protein [Microbispora sp. NPDC049125]|uniref:condensation domain-containing protein n=1 Tax=Microbispora sp. NPDC049125 TaxID=3154929 RepID=UPI0034666190
MSHSAPRSGAGIGSRPPSPERSHPASYAQQGMWITELAGAGSTYHMPLPLTLEGPLDVPAMLGACAAVLDRHEALGHALRESGGEVVVTEAATRPAVDHGDPPPGEDPDKLVEAEACRPFDIARGPLARFRLAALGPDRHLLVFVAHHLVFDGVSKDLVVAALAAEYAARVRGEATPSETPPGCPSLAEVVRAERERVEAAREAAARFWAPRWHDPDGVPLPGGFAAAPRRAGPGNSIALSLPPGTAARAGELGVTTFELLMTAMHAVLHAYGADEVTVAADLSTRRPETERIVGLFVNELPVVTRPAGTLRELAGAVRAELRAVYGFREVPLPLAVGGVSPRASLAPVSFSYRRRGEVPEFPGLSAAVDWAAWAGGVRGALHLQAVEGPGSVDAYLRYNPRAVTAGDAELVARALSAVVEQAAGADTPLAELRLPRPVVQAVAPPVPLITPPAERGEAGPADHDLTGEVTRIWCDVLRIDEIGPDEDLFDLGGHSIAIMQIVARVRKRYGVELDIDVFFDTPTIAGVVEAITELQEAS